MAWLTPNWLTRVSDSSVSEGKTHTHSCRDFLTYIVDLVTFLRNKYVTVEGVKIGSRIWKKVKWDLLNKPRMYVYIVFNMLTIWEKSVFSSIFMVFLRVFWCFTWRFSWLITSCHHWWFTWCFGWLIARWHTRSCRRRCNHIHKKNTIWAMQWGCADGVIDGKTLGVSDGSALGLNAWLHL